LHSWVGRDWTGVRFSLYLFTSCWPRKPFDDGQQIVVDKKDGVGVREEGLAGEDAAQSDGTIVQCRNIKSSINLNLLLIITGAIFSHTWIDHDRTSLMIIADIPFQC
jgi:hypothetical protein